MAYENGDIIEDYFGENIKRYKDDNLIFVKALAIINTFLNRPEWPHCIEELERTVNPILGDSLEFLGFRGHYFEDEYMKWSEKMDTPEAYKRDAISFYKTVNPIIMQYYYNRLEPLKLYSIVSTQDTINSDNKIVRFIRSDGEKLDVQVDNYAIKEAISVLSDLLESDENEC